MLHSRTDWEFGPRGAGRGLPRLYSSPVVRSFARFPSPSVHPSPRGGGAGGEVGRGGVQVAPRPAAPIGGIDCQGTMHWDDSRRTLDATPTEPEPRRRTGHATGPGTGPTRRWTRCAVPTAATSIPTRK